MSLQGGDSAVMQGPLILRLAHPGRPALDRALPLTSQGHQTYQSTFPPLTPGRWQVTLEDSARTWRLVGDALVPSRGTIEIMPR